MALEEEESCKIKAVKENIKVKKELRKCKSILNEKTKLCESLQEELTSRSLNLYHDSSEAERKQKLMSQEIKKLNQEVDALRKENLSLFNEICQITKEAAELERRLAESAMLLTSCPRELELSKSRINELQSKIFILKKQKSDLLEEAQEHSRRSLASVVIEFQLKEKEEFISKLQNEIAELNTTFQEEIKQQMNKINNLLNQKKAVKSQLNLVQGQVESLKEVENNLLGSVESLKSQLSSAVDRNSTLDSELKCKTDLIVRLESEVEEKDRRVNEMSNDIAEKEVKLLELYNKTENLQLEKNTLDSIILAQKTSYESGINILKNHLETQKTHCEETCLQLKGVELTDEHDLLTEKYKQLVAEKDGIRDEYQQKLNKLKEQMKEICFQAMRKAEEDQEKKIKQYKQSILQHEEQNKQLSAQLWDTSDKLVLTKKENTSLKSTVVDLQRQFNSQRDSRALLNRTRSHENLSRDHMALMMDTEEFLTLTRRRSVRTVPSGLGKVFPSEDETDKMFSQECLADLKAGRCAIAANPDRVSTLMYRNSLCPPHLKSSYQAETQFLPLDAPLEIDIKGKGNDSDNKSITSNKRRKDQGQVATPRNVLKESNDGSKPGTPSRIFSTIFPKRHRGEENTPTSSSQQP